MSKKPAAMPIFGDAYLADTTHLSTEEHGAYFLLMLAAWRRTECDLPNDDKKLARIAGVSPQKWKSMKDTVLEFWTVENDIIFQKRQRQEMRWVKQKSDSNSKNSVEGWKKRKSGASGKQVIDNIEDGVSERNAIAKRNVCESDAPPPPPTLEEEAKASPSVSLPIDEAVEYWMLAAQKYGWKKPSLPLSQHRRKKLSSRLKENGMEGWKDALRRACQGRPGKEAPTWFTFDFITKNTDNILKVLEGNYDGEFFNGTGNNQNRGPGSAYAQVSDPILNAIHKRQKARMATDGLGEHQPLLSASVDPH